MMSSVVTGFNVGSFPEYRTNWGIFDVSLMYWKQ